MRAGVRKGLKAAGIVLAAIPVVALVAAAALLLYARSDSGRERLRHLVLEQARASLPGLEIKRIGGDYLHDLIVEDVTLRDRQGRPAVHVDRVTARFSLIPLVRKRVFVRELIVERPRVLGRPTKNGGMNLAELTAPSEKKKPAEAPPRKAGEGPGIAVQVDRLVVSGGSADVETPAGQAIIVDRFEVAGRMALAGEEVRAELAPLTVGAVVDGKPYRVHLVTRAMMGAKEIHAVLDELVVGGVAEGGDVVVRAQVGGPRERVGFRADVVLPAEGRIQAHGNVGLPAAGGLGAYALALTAGGIDPHALVATAPAGRLGMAVNARGEGTPLAPGSRAVVAVTMPPSRIADLRILELVVEASSEGEAWRLERALLRGAGAQVNARGQGKGNVVQAHVRASVGDPDDGRLPAPDFRGRGALTADLRGTLPDDFQVEATGNGAKLAVGTTRIGSLALKANGSADKAARTMSLAARVGLRQLRAGEVKVRNVDVTANAAGPFATPRGKVRVAAYQVNPGAGAPALDKVLVDLNSDGRNLRLRGAAAGPGGRGGLDAHGVVTAREARVTLERFSLDLRSKQMTQAIALQKPVGIRWRAGDLVELGELKVSAKGSKLSGDFKASGMYRLDVGGRLEPRATAALSMRKAVVTGMDPVDADGWVKLWRKRLQGGIEAKVAGKADLKVAAEVPLVPGRGGAAPRLAKDGPLDVQVHTNKIQLQDLPLLHKQLSRRGVSGGIVSLAASIKGDVAHPDAKIALDMRSIEVRKVTGEGRDSVVRRIPGVGANINIDTRRGLILAGGEVLMYGAGFLKLDSKLKIDLGQVLAGADATKAPVEIDVDIPKFQIASMKGYFDQLRDTEGVLAGRVSVRGTLARPTGGGTITVSNARVDKVRFGPVEARASSDGDRVKAEVKIQQLQGGSLVAHADLDRAGKAPLAVKASARKLDIGFARLFTTGVRELAGTVDADARVAGSPARPEVQGMVYYYEGRLGLVGQPTFHDLAVTLALKPGRVDIQKLQAYSGGGSFIGKGWVTLDGVQPTGLVLTANANRFVVAAAGSSGARLDGDLAVAAEMRERVMAGQVKVPQASVWLPKVGPGGKKLQKIGQHEDVRFVDQAAKAAAEKKRDAEAAGKTAGPRQLDIKATAGTMFVRAKDLDIELASNLHVTSNADGDPLINGQVVIRRGRINITGQRFDFEPGRISFDGSTNPNLSIRITHQYPEALVVVEIRGTPKKPELRLTSDPPIYDQAQIVSLVMTGQPGGQPSTGGSFDPTAAIATAVLGKLADKLAPELGLDVLRVESVKERDEEGVATAEADTRIEVGKYISERVYLSYAHVFGAPETQNRNEAHVEYRVTRRWLVETIFGDAGVGGVDALWTHRY